MKSKLLSALAAAMIGFGPAVHADELISEQDIGGKISANVGVVSEYMWRSLSQSGNGTPAVQGGFDYAHNSGVYLGTWGSNVDFGGNLEMDFYGGWAGDLGTSGLGLDVGLIYYHYPGQTEDADLDFVEGYAGLSRDFGPLAAGIKASFSPEFTANSGEAWYLEGNVDVPAGRYFTVNLHVGNQTVDDNNAYGFDDYTDWLIGVSFQLLGFDAQIAYLDNDLNDSDCVGGCDRFVASLSRSF